LTAVGSTVREEPWWSVQRGSGAVVATAIHDGHGLRDEVREAIKLSEADRLREEDPFTGHAIKGVPTHVIAGRSRFEFDLNRQADEAIYTTPAQSWGLEVWHTAPEPEMVARSLDIHAAFYRMMGDLLDEVAKRHERFVVLDVHSYNHRRGGPDAQPTPQDEAPDVNIGTFSMPRDFWAPVLDPIIEAMREFDFNGRQLDVRENVAFQGKGALTRFVHERYPQRGCAVAIEFKKFYMDEWTGAPVAGEVAAMQSFITKTACAARDALA
jgi:N-formylglutamate amidohydrolase